MPEPVESAGEGGRYRIGVFEFDEDTLELRKNGRTLKVRPQSLKLLTLLLRRAAAATITTVVHWILLAESFEPRRGASRSA